MSTAYDETVRQAAKVLHIEGLSSREIRERLNSGTAGLSYVVDPAERTIDQWRRAWKAEGSVAGFSVRSGDEEAVEDAVYYLASSTKSPRAVLKVYNLKDKKETEIGEFNSYVISANLKKMMLSKDGDFAITPELVSDHPAIEQTLRSAGFEPITADRPGLWCRGFDEQGQPVDEIDLLAPAALAGPGTRSVKPLSTIHGKMAVGRVPGIELAVYDRDLIHHAVRLRTHTWFDPSGEWTPDDIAVRYIALVRAML